MTRLELANQLIENQPAFHFAFIPVNCVRTPSGSEVDQRLKLIFDPVATALGSETVMVRVERFAPLTKLVLSQPPLPIGLHAQSDFLRLVLARGFEPTLSSS